MWCGNDYRLIMASILHLADIKYDEYHFVCNAMQKEIDFDVNLMLSLRLLVACVRCK